MAAEAKHLKDCVKCVQSVELLDKPPAECLSEWQSTSMTRTQYTLVSLWIRHYYINSIRQKVLLNARAATTLY